MTLTKVLLVAAGVFGSAAAVLAVVYAAQPTDQFAACRADDMIDHAQIGGPFELIDETGRAVTQAELFDRPTLFYMGYTFCPDVCPMDNMRNADTVYLLDQGGVDAQAAFVSVDPKRDTPEVLAEFTDFFHPEMIGVTGTTDQVRSLAQSYASTFELRDEAEDGYYLIDHTTFTFLVLPDHGVVDVIRRDETAETVAERATCLISKA